MAAGILSEDFVALCLLLAEGDLGRDLLEVAEAAAQYRLSRGVVWAEDDDVECALYSLIWEWREGAGGFDFDLSGRPLSDWLDRMLSYQEVYFNDEGAHWLRTEGPTRLSHKRVSRFLQRLEWSTPEDVLARLYDTGLRASLLADDAPAIRNRWESWMDACVCTLELRAGD